MKTDTTETKHTPALRYNGDAVQVQSPNGLWYDLVYVRTPLVEFEPLAKRVAESYTACRSLPDPEKDVARLREMLSEMVEAGKLAGWDLLNEPSFCKGVLADAEKLLSRLQPPAIGGAK